MGLSSPQLSSDSIDLDELRSRIKAYDGYGTSRLRQIRALHAHTKSQSRSFSASSIPNPVNGVSAQTSALLTNEGPRAPKRKAGSRLKHWFVLPRM